MLLAFMGFALMDELAHHFDKVRIPFMQRNDRFWDKSLSWLNKWDVNHIGEVERFWGSSRWFVFLTDGWHLVQFLSYHCIAWAIAIQINEGMKLDFKGDVALCVAAVHSMLVTCKALTMNWIKGYYKKS